MERMVTDQMGFNVYVSAVPKRIISLVPSQTELLASLGLDEEVVGITRYCAHPKSWNKSKTIIGGTKKFDFEIISFLKPDLIIGNKEENYEEGIQLLKQKYPVWMSDIATLQHSMEMILSIGEMVNRVSIAKTLIENINNSFQSIHKFNDVPALYLIWKNPWMGAASQTFIHEMLLQAGFKNVLGVKIRYPEVTDEEIRRLSPDVVLLSSEPYPFKGKHIKEINSIVPDAKVVLVDGELFSWYGSRMLYFTDYISKLKSQLG